MVKIISKIIGTIISDQLFKSQIGVWDIRTSTGDAAAIALRKCSVNNALRGTKGTKTGKSR